jgi:TPR repeat protein
LKNGRVAILHLGASYMDGSYGCLDILKAFDWCIKAAELRSPQAYSAIGSYCLKGFFGKDKERADLFV